MKCVQWKFATVFPLKCRGMHGDCQTFTLPTFMLLTHFPVHCLFNYIIYIYSDCSRK